jgi:AcrR family transcriptional regulator
MERAMDGVKRRYDSGARRARAEEVRESLVAAARRMLLTEGYAATTIARIAQECGVSADSVYKRFGGKPGLVRAVVEQALRGEGSVPAEARSDALPAGDLQQLLVGWGGLSAEVSPRVAPILLLVRAAAEHDPTMAVLARELEAERLTRMTANARRVSAAGHLPVALTVGGLADLLWTYSSPELYELLVLKRGWDLARYSAFISSGLAGQLGVSAAGGGASGPVR